MQQRCVVTVLQTMADIDTRILGDPGTPAFQVRKYPFYLLNRLVGLYNKVIERELRAIGLEIPAWRVLMILGEKDPSGTRDISGAAMIPISTMTRIIQRMAAAGLVTTAASAADARVTLVSLTPLGQERLAQARRATAPVYARVIRGLDRDEFEKLLSLLERLHDNLEGSNGA